MTSNKAEGDSVAVRKLSVIIPAMNAARTLAPLLDDLLALEVPPGWELEFLAGYTESHDNTLEILQSRPVKIVRCTTIGPGAARNVAVREASGSVFHFIDADARPVGDDFYLRLICAAETLESDEKLGGFGGPILLDRSQRWNPIAQADHFACWFNWSALREDQKSNLFQPGVSFVMPRSVYEMLGGFDTSIRVLEDFDLHQRVLAAGYNYYFVQDVAVTHRARGTLLTSWRHSWYWGAPYRSAYLEKIGESKFGIPPESRWFWLNLPLIYLQRMKLVLRSARRVSMQWTLVSLPFIAITVFSWSLASVVRREQPSANTPTAV
jgi:glycosyltransferase involved in cell wall biosynthesis